jgi:hypothetical protein
MSADGSFGKNPVRLFLGRSDQLLPGYSKESMISLSGEHQQISTESLILAQDERWRRA